PHPGTAPTAHPETFPPNPCSHRRQKLQYFRLHKWELRLGRKWPARIACWTAGYSFCVCSTSDGSMVNSCCTNSGFLVLVSVSSRALPVPPGISCAYVAI